MRFILALDAKSVALALVRAEADAVVLLTKAVDCRADLQASSEPLANPAFASSSFATITTHAGHSRVPLSVT